MKKIFYLINYCLLAIAAIIIISYYCFVVEIKVVGRSMEPSLFTGDVGYSFKYKAVKRFDIIVFHHEQEAYIKRVIGLSNEKITIIENQLFVNNNPVKQPVILNSNYEVDDLEIDVPKNCYFVLGDNRLLSYDSRHFGVIEKSDIISVGFFKIASKAEIDYELVSGAYAQKLKRVGAEEKNC